jgi:hypothetical protein
MVELHHHQHKDGFEQEVEMKFSTEEEMKEWFWEQHKEEILASMTTGSNSCRSSSQILSSPLMGPNKELDSARKSLRLLDFIAKVQRQFMQQEEVCCARLNDFRLDLA